MMLLHFPDICPDREGGWYYTEQLKSIKPLYQADQMWEHEEGEWHCRKHRHQVVPELLSDREMTLRMLRARPLVHTAPDNLIQEIVDIVTSRN